MATDDKCCTVVPYFTVPEDRLDEFREVVKRCVAQTEEEPGCLYYGFSFHGDQVHCREGYSDANAVLIHLERIAPLLGEALTIGELTRLEVHGPADEIDKLRAPMAEFNPQFYVLEYGFRR